MLNLIQYLSEIFLGVLTGFSLYLFAEKAKRMSFQSLTHIEISENQLRFQKALSYLKNKK